jgi:hypothetical protein
VFIQHFLRTCYDNLNPDDSELQLQWLLTNHPPPSIGAVKYWEIIADNLKKAGWSWGCVSAIDSEGRTIWIADAHRGDGKAFRCARR